MTKLKLQIHVKLKYTAFSLITIAGYDTNTRCQNLNFDDFYNPTDEQITEQAFHENAN